MTSDASALRRRRTQVVEKLLAEALGAFHPTVIDGGVEGRFGETLVVLRDKATINQRTGFPKIDEPTSAQNGASGLSDRRQADWDAGVTGDMRPASTEGGSASAVYRFEMLDRDLNLVNRFDSDDVDVDPKSIDAFFKSARAHDAPYRSAEDG